MQQLFRRFNMARIVFFITLISLFWVISSGKLVFAQNSPYSVKGVEVDVLDESSVKARNKAFAEAQRKAFQILSTRFYAEGELAVLKIPSDEKLSGFIQDFKIASEQVSTKRYKGVFDFRFKAGPVHQYFGRGPVYFVEDTVSDVKKILLIPYYHEEKKQIVFNKAQNPFWGSLLEDLKDRTYVILPEGNIQDLTDIGYKTPGYLSSTTVRRLKARYDVTQIVVATARVDLEDQSKINIDIQDVSSGTPIPLKNFDADPKEIAKETFDILGGLSESKDIPLDSIETLNNTEKEETEIPESEIKFDNFDPENNGEIPRGKMSLAARQQMIAKSLDQQRQQKMDLLTHQGRDVMVADQDQAQVGEGIESSVNASVNASVNEGEANVQVFFTSMSEWVSLQKELSHLDGLRGIRIVTLKTNQADTVIEYKDWNKMLGSLKSRGLLLTPQSADSYILKRVPDGF